MSDPTLPTELADLRDRVARSSASRDPGRGRAGARPAVRGAAARAAAAGREAGVFAPHVAEEPAGSGSTCAAGVVFEAAGYSLLGPLALNCAAPDEGNMHLLERGRDREQQERYLRAARRRRDALVLRDDRAGARRGLRPGHAARRRAERDGGGWVINGRKWFITGAAGAAFAICMARTAEVTRRHGATMFLVDAGNPGFESCATSPRSTARARRPLRGRVRRLPGRRRRGARRGRPRLPLRPGAARAGAADALHALARHRPPRARHRPRPRARARGVRPAARATSAWCSR